MSKLIMHRDPNKAQPFHSVLWHSLPYTHCTQIPSSRRKDPRRNHGNCYNSQGHSASVAVSWQRKAGREENMGSTSWKRAKTYRKCWMEGHQMKVSHYWALGCIQRTSVPSLHFLFIASLALSSVFFALASRTVWLLSHLVLSQPCQYVPWKM